MKVKKQKCIAHFKGVDSKGTCDTKCQWYLKDKYCPNSNKYE